MSYPSELGTHLSELPLVEMEVSDYIMNSLDCDRRDRLELRKLWERRVQEEIEETKQKLRRAR